MRCLKSQIAGIAWRQTGDLDRGPCKGSTVASIACLGASGKWFPHFCSQNIYYNLSCGLACGFLAGALAVVLRRWSADRRRVALAWSTLVQLAGLLRVIDERRRAQVLDRVWSVLVEVATDADH